MSYRYMTRGTCSRQIDFQLEGNVVRGVIFTGGCHGNLQGVARLVEGMTVEEVIGRLKGIRCGNKPTSCPDQLCIALEAALAKQKALEQE